MVCLGVKCNDQGISKPVPASTNCFVTRHTARLTLSRQDNIQNTDSYKR